MAARLNGKLAALALQAARYVGAMAQASTKSAAFDVNAFIPDGIVSTKAFDGVEAERRRQPRARPAATGLGAKFTVGQVKQAIAAAKQAKALLAKSGVPELKIRVGEHAGVFTDLHVERFGLLAASSPTVTGERLGGDGEIDRGARQPRRRGLPRRGESRHRAARR